MAVVAALVFAAAMFVYVVGARVTFPFELEWMTGSVLDHVERVRGGADVYAAPTAGWIPYLYPPLYYWLAAPLGGSFLACRLLSLVATATQAICIARLAKRAGATPFWRLVGVGLFLACFPFVGWWYDLERSDTVFVAIMLVATTILVETSSIPGAVLAGVLLGLGFFAKQPALAFIAAAFVAVLYRREWLRAAAILMPSVVLVIGGTAWLDAKSSGWFSYYTLKLPKAHGVMLSLVPEVLSYDVVYGCVLLFATVAYLLGWLKTRDRDQAIVTAMVGAGLAVAISARLHIGGWINVLQPWTSFACVAAAALGARYESRSTALRATAYAAVIVQVALWYRDPRSRVPDAASERDTRELHAVIHRLEERGEVLLVGRGHVTAKRHFQMAALADVVKGGLVPSDLLDGLRERRFAAVIDDGRPHGQTPPRRWAWVMLEDVEEIRDTFLANYYVAEELEHRIGRVTLRAPAGPRYVFLPRKQPLALTGDALKRRQSAEMELAAAHVPAGEIEALAAARVPR
jgi:hypothetical protein